MTPEQRQWIDSAPLDDLLRRWRFGACDDPIFQGEAGRRLSERLFRIRDEDPAAWTAASKRIGWS